MTTVVRTSVAVADDQLRLIRLHSTTRTFDGRPNARDHAGILDCWRRCVRLKDNGRRQVADEQKQDNAKKLKLCTRVVKHLLTL